jgi:hypothetical protein
LQDLRHDPKHAAALRFIEHGRVASRDTNAPTPRAHRATSSPHRESCDSDAAPGGRWSRCPSAAGPNIRRPDTKSSSPTSTIAPPHMARRMTWGFIVGPSGIHGSFAPQDGHAAARSLSTRMRQSGLKFSE